MAKKVQTPDNRILGAHSGATVLPDGRVEVAPMHRDSWARIYERDAAAHTLYLAAQNFMIDQLKACVRDRQDWFKYVLNDLFGENRSGWSFDGRYLVPPPKTGREFVEGDI